MSSVTRRIRRGLGERAVVDGEAVNRAKRVHDRDHVARHVADCRLCQVRARRLGVKVVP